MTEPLRILGIPVSKPLFGIYWGLTNAQIELLAMDVSIVVTDHEDDDNGKSPDKKGFKSPSAKEIEAAANRWKEKYSDGNVTVCINDYK